MRSGISWCSADIARSRGVIIDGLAFGWRCSVAWRLPEDVLLRGPPVGDPAWEGPAFDLAFRRPAPRKAPEATWPGRRSPGCAGRRPDAGSRRCPRWRKRPLTPGV